MSHFLFWIMRNILLSKFSCTKKEYCEFKCTIYEFIHTFFISTDKNRIIKKIKKIVNITKNKKKENKKFQTFLRRWRQRWLTPKKSFP